MKIVVVSTYYSIGMGYTENSLPRALAARGHEVHVITSSLNVYGDGEDYDRVYRSFLGPADQGIGCFNVDGYTVHRLRYRRFGGYVAIVGLAAKLKKMRPDIVHSTAIASLQSYQLAALRLALGFKLFAENHQHRSVVKPFLKQRGHYFRKVAFWLTRTLPGWLVSNAIECCYAIAPDCVEVARDLYGVPARKLKLQSLGTDTLLFRAAETGEEMEARERGRRELGFEGDDIVCVYTGRFTPAKNPLVLAEAIDRLGGGLPRYYGLFVGEGEQRARILECRNSRILAFRSHAELAQLYRLADVAVWPRQESMSMLDAAASALPIVVSANIGERDRVDGNGMYYAENDCGDLARVLSELASAQKRRELGMRGRAKMVAQFSWSEIAVTIESDYRLAMSGRR